MSRKSIAMAVFGVVLAQIVAIAGGLWPLVLFAGGLAALAATGSMVTAALREPEPSRAAASFDIGEALDHWRSRTEVLVSWADGTPADWDRHIRPILGREVQLALGGNLAPDRGEFAFGQWWVWVDPLGRGTGQKAPGRRGLEEILARLEWMTTGEAAA